MKRPTGLRVVDGDQKSPRAPSDPRASAFVAANAGAGKTYTLVQRVARLLLNGATPEAILCVTYTKAGAAEMQRRLFEQLGDWAVAPGERLTRELAAIDEARKDLSGARKLFARALETPGGLKIQTIHAFCEKLLKRFPLEAGVSPGFTVLEDAAAAELSARARDSVARLALTHRDSRAATAYDHFAVQLDFERFRTMFADFEARRTKIAAYIDRSGGLEGAERDVWRRCGFPAPVEPEDVQDEALGRIRMSQWKRAAAGLDDSPLVSDRKMAATMAACAEALDWATWISLFLTAAGAKPRDRLAGKTVDPWTKDWLLAEQARVVEALARYRSAVVARDTTYALILASLYADAYELEKSHRHGLDFHDLISATQRLLTVRADAAWVLFKLDGGIDHVLLDEAQDTAPEQWAILRALTAEFFTDIGAGRRARTVFAVGDDKQSIFSFQGAAPERFAQEGRAYRAMAASIGQPFADEPLLTSRRSAPEVLTFVDAVFAEPAALAGLRPGVGAFAVTPVVHRPVRPAGGCVESWPLEVTESAEELDPWAPVDAEPKESANHKLARRIARSVRAMIDRREAVWEKDGTTRRACSAGDVMILVRRRNALFHEIIRALKRADVPVGGADRMPLAEHAVFQDLVALGRFARFAGDELTLAGLLRSPFCDVSEESLFDLAYGRAGGLWAVLERRAGERAEWRQARDFLAWASTEAAARPPFDFYSRVLSRLDGDGRSMRARMLTRLGAEAQDALDAFLAQALAAEGRDIRDLERFLAAMAATEIEVKREQEDSGGEVRVMTAHGAKGLEAPIVILPDTTTRATAQGGPLLDTGDGGYLWAPRKVDDCAASGEARALRDKLGDEESLRLLYVALTRARDRLIIAGTMPMRPHLMKGSWREYADLAFAGLETRPLAMEDGGEGVRFGPDPGVADAAPIGPAAGAVLPDWAGWPAPAEAAALRYASPSTVTEETRGAAPSPLSAVGGLGRFRRGDIIHRLLQRLPDLPADERADGAAALLAREPGLGDGQRDEMAAAALAVLADPRFAEVFGPGSRAEVALAGAAARLPAGLAISGRVDRLVVTAERVLVVDFKTNRPAPATIEAADSAYIAQMAVYRAVLTEVFPDHKVEAALVWTDGPRLMPVTEKLMDQALDALAANS